MDFRKTAAALLSGAVCILAGCTQTGTVKNFFSSIGKLAPSDAAAPGDESGDEWNIVGEEARKHYVLEKDPDPWWKSYMMSEKARSIEHNLGVD